MNALWSPRRPALVLAGLVLALLASALAVVYSTHHGRLLFDELQQLQRQGWALEEEWEKLLLEQGAWGAHERIRSQAEQHLDMAVPKPEGMRVVGHGN